MRYSTLIRKLVQASEEAKYQHTDIADKLKERCTQEAGIIRQTLMNAVCDPRFRMHIGAVPSWRQLVRTKLEDFAKKLEQINGLTESIALSEMDEMLMDWFDEVVSVVERMNSNLTFDVVKEKRSADEIKKALEEYIEGKSIIEDDSDDSLEILWSGEDTEDPLGYSNGGDNNKEEDCKSSPKDIKEDDEKSEQNSQGKLPSYGIGNGGKGTEKDVEERFFKKVPPSLIELARQIGRSYNVEGEPQGKFLKASKSDIAGVTTGNDLNCLLPSELALMADSQTENIFYKNFITRNLQLFASVSHSSKGNKRHDGPIIICLDTSGSMDGEPMIVAKALTFAVCIIAQRKKRKVIVVKYSDSHESFFLSNISRQRKKLMEFLSHAEVGGNNEDELFRWLFTDILPKEGDYQSGDILCVSDFGWMPISPDVMELIKKEKKKNLLFYGLNIGREDLEHGFYAQYAGLGKFSGQEIEMEEGFASPADICDSLWEYCDGKCKEVKSIKTSGKTIPS